MKFRRRESQLSFLEFGFCVAVFVAASLTLTTTACTSRKIATGGGAVAPQTGKSARVAAQTPMLTSPPLASSGPPASRVELPRDVAGRLEWVASWQGPPPVIFATNQGDFLLTVLDHPRLGLSPVLVTAKAESTTPTSESPRQLSFVRLAPDGTVRSSVSVTYPFAWAEGLSRFDNGDLLVQGQKRGSITLELLCINESGKILWTRPLGQYVVIDKFSSDPQTGRVALTLVSGSAAADAELGRVTHSLPNDTNKRTEIRLYDGSGTLTYTSSIDRAKVSWLSVARDNGLVLGGVAEPSLVGKNPFLSVESLSKPAFWFASVDGHGAVRWARTISMQHYLLFSSLRFLDDSTLLLAGSMQRPEELGHVLSVPDPAVSNQVAGSPGSATAQIKQAGFLLSLDAKNGASKRLDRLPAAAWPWFSSTAGADLWVRDVPDSETVELLALDANAQQRWRLSLGADEANQVASLPDRRHLIQGRYSDLYLVAGLDPPAALVSGSSFAWYLALVDEVPNSAAPSLPRVLDREAILRNPKPSAAANFATLKRRALSAFRAKRYREACDLFAQAQAYKPKDTFNLGELGLCQARAEEDYYAAFIDRYALWLDFALERSSSGNHDTRARQAIYYNLAQLDKGKKDFVALADPDCVAWQSDALGCSKPIFSCAKDGSYGMDTRVMITTFKVARFALTADDAKLESFDGISWPQFGTSPDETYSRADQPSYDVTISCDADGRDGNYNTVSDETSECYVMYADGCSGRLALHCTWKDTRSSDPAISKVIELEFTQ